MFLIARVLMNGWDGLDASRIVKSRPRVAAEAEGRGCKRLIDGLELRCEGEGSRMEGSATNSAPRRRACKSVQHMGITYSTSPLCSRMMPRSDPGSGHLSHASRLSFVGFAFGFGPLELASARRRVFSRWDTDMSTIVRMRSRMGLPCSIDLTEAVLVAQSIFAVA